MTEPPLRSTLPLVVRIELSADGEPVPPAQEAAPAVPDPLLELRRAELERRERALDEREERVAGDELTASERIRLANRAQRIDELESELEDRLRDVDLHEDELRRRTAEFEADVELREQRIERWRVELDELEARLERREGELTAFAAQLQGELVRGAAWWRSPAVQH